jgi:hypothetical protein
MSLPQTIEEITQTMMGSNAALVDSARNANIATEGDLSVAVDLLSTIKERVKNIEGERTKIVKPINDSVKHINTRFKTISEPLEDAQAGLSKKILAYQRIVEEQKKAEAEKIRLAREAELLAAAQVKEELGNTEGAEKLLNYAMAVKPVVEETGRGGFTGAKSSISMVWTYEVLDIVTLANADSSLVSENSAAIREKVRAGVREIAGLRIYQKEQLSIRG